MLYNKCIKIQNRNAETMAEVHIWKSSLVSRRLWPFLEYLYGRSAPVRSARIIQHLQFSSSLVRARALIKGLATGEVKLPRLILIQPEYSKRRQQFQNPKEVKNTKLLKYKNTKQWENPEEVVAAEVRSLTLGLHTWLHINYNFSETWLRFANIPVPGISLEIWAFYLRPTSLHCTFGIW